MVTMANGTQTFDSMECNGQKSARSAQINYDDNCDRSGNNYDKNGVSDIDKNLNEKIGMSGCGSIKSNFEYFDSMKVNSSKSDNSNKNKSVDDNKSEKNNEDDNGTSEQNENEKDDNVKTTDYDSLAFYESTFSEILLLSAVAEKVHEINLNNLRSLIPKLEG